MNLVRYVNDGRISDGYRRTQAESKTEEKPEIKRQKGKVDTVLLLAVLFLTAFGLVMLYSTSTYNGRVRFHDEAYYLKKQLFATALGLLSMYVVSGMDYHILVRLALPGYLMSLGLSGLVLVAGETYNGSKRWISLGPLSFQPAEFAKLAVILLLARIISERKNSRSSATIFIVMGAVLPIVALVGTNNLSTAIIILGIAVIMIFISSPRYVPFVWIGLAGAGLSGIFLGMDRTAWSAWRYGDIGKLWKGFQTIQGCMQSVQAGFLERAWAIAFRNWALCRRRRMI